MKKFTAIIWGVALVALGIILGGNALGVFNIDIFFKGWWTLLIIVPSVVGLFTDKEKLSNLVCIGIGVCLLLAAQEVFSYGVAWTIILGLVLIGVGISIIYKNVIKQDAKPFIEGFIVHEEDEKDD